MEGYTRRRAIDHPATWEAEHPPDEGPKGRKATYKYLVLFSLHFLVRHGMFGLKLCFRHDKMDEGGYRTKIDTYAVEQVKLNTDMIPLTPR
jgi:hypothetical protein